MLTCDVFFPHPLVGRQQVLDIEVTPERYAMPRSPPQRTFGFEYELDQMRNMGLKSAQGASLEKNAQSVSIAIQS